MYPREISVGNSDSAPTDSSVHSISRSRLRKIEPVAA